MNLYFHGVWRMDWGYGNPNKTATLIVSLIFAAWGLTFLGRKGFWLALGLSTGLGVLLIHTFSRGGIVSFIGGSLVLICFAPRPWIRERLIGCIVAIGLICGAAIYLRANQRFMQGTEDRSITNRVEIWKKVPEMMADAPGGWGLGNAARAYQNWYQAPDHREKYANLVSSHFNWLVEFSWWERILYCFGWLAVGLLCWPTKPRENHYWFALPFAIWLSFFLGCVFTHVAESVTLWAVPLVALLIVLAVRWKRGLWPSIRLWALAFSFAATVVVTMTIFGALSPNLHVRASDKVVKIGPGEPRVWIIANPKMMGVYYGKALRQYIEEHPSLNAVGIAKFVADIPKEDSGMLVVLGNVPQSDWKLLGTREKLLLVDPFFSPQDAGVVREKVAGVLFGEFSASPCIRAWQDTVPVRTIPGVGDFLAAWPDLIFSDLTFP